MQLRTSHPIRRGRTRRMIATLSATILLAPLASPCLGQAEDRQGDRRQSDDGERGGGRDRGMRGMRGMGGAGRALRGMGMRQWLEPDFLRRDMVLFVDELGLDDDQSAIVEVLLRDYEDGFGAASDQMRERLQEMRPHRADEEQRREQMRSLIDTIRTARQELRAARGQLTGGEDLDPAFEEAARAKLQAAREQLRELRPSPPEGEELEQLKRNITDLAGEWRSLRSGLKSEFMTSLYAILAEKQVQQWPSFEKKLRREKTLRSGRLSGESVDLLLVLRSLDLGEEERAMVEDVLEGYAQDLDTALSARNEHLESTRIESISSMLDRDFERLAEMTERESQLRRKVRDVNDRYAELLKIMLSERVSSESADAFEHAYLERAYPQVYRPTITQRAFGVAAQMEDLDDETRLGIEAIEQAYEAELEGSNNLLVETLRAHEPQQMLRRIERFQRWAERERQRDGNRQDDRSDSRGWRRDQDREDPIDDAFDDRRELDRRYRQHLESLLTPEQIEQLPAERRGRGGGDRWRGRGEDGERGEDRLRQMMERFDADGDGALSDAEREAARAARRAERDAAD